MKAVIVSDLHIGSRNFVFHEFKSFIERIPTDYELILNGDVIDDPKQKLTPLHQRILDIIVRVSYRQKVVWVHGNHDEGFVRDDIGKIEYKSNYTVNKNVFIAHGHDFDQIMPMCRQFMSAFMLMHNLRIYLGAPQVHVSDYAKKWNLPYSVLRKNVMKNAVNTAKANNCTTVVCGHTHYVEEHWVDDIRYINTGSWTESPAYCILADNKNMVLKSVRDCFTDQMDQPLHEKVIQAA